MFKPHLDCCLRETTKVTVLGAVSESYSVPVCASWMMDRSKLRLPSF